jgi:peroxiredoxin
MDGKTRTLAEYNGKPVIVIFYLGYGCLHCAEQLKEMTKKIDRFRNAGFEVVAISTDKQENLKRAYADLEAGFPFPLLADPEMNVFRQYRCYDDFEKAALHGTFVIDRNGLVRWQDISFEPFMDMDFLLKESIRLLNPDLKASISSSSRGEAE